MLNARLFLAALVAVGSALAACSGNFGAGTTAPGQVIPSGPFNPASPSPTPNSANGIVTYGQSDALQPFPNVAGYGGAIAFPVPSPKPSGFDNIPVGVTVALVAPTDAPDLNVQVGGKRPKRRERPARPLLYVSLLATRDITLANFPRIAIDVPRDIVTLYREEELGLAYYNSSDKTKTYRLAVASLESLGTPPAVVPSAAASGAASVPASVAPGSGAPSGSGAPVATPSPTPTPTPSPTGSATPGPLPSGAASGRLTPPPSASPSPSPTLPPQRVTFAAAVGPVKFAANKPVVFALYALPQASPSPSPRRSGSAGPSTSSSPEPAGSGSGSAAPRPEPSVAPPSAPSPPVPPGSPSRTTI